MTDPVWKGVTIDPKLLENFGWYVDTITVGGQVYSRLIGYFQAGLLEMDDKIAEGTAAIAAILESGQGDLDAAVTSAEASASAAEAAASNAAEDAAATAADRSAVASDKTTVSADKGLTQGYRNEAETFKNQAQAAVGGVRVTSNDTTAGSLSSKLVAGDNITLTVVNPGANETLRVDGQGGATVLYSGILNIPSAGTATINGQMILAVYEQYTGTTFNLPFTTEADYIQENAATGTDDVGGAFQLYNSAGAVIDTDTRLLIHADGMNGSTEIIDERGITPFGTHCAYFDGTAYWKVPSSAKIAFGNQNVTYECWFRLAVDKDCQIFDTRTSSSTNGTVGLYYETATKKLSFYADTQSGTGNVIDPLIWHHAAVVRLAGVAYLFVDGVPHVTTSNTTVNLGASPINIGGNYSPGNFVNGWVDQFRVSKVARYTGAFTPPTAEFTPDADTVHLPQFNDGHGSQFIRDSAKSGHEISVGANLSSAWAKFGATSLRLSSSTGPTQIAAAKGHADLALGALDFTIDFHGRVDSIANQIFLKFDGSSYGLEMYVNGTSGNLELYASSNGTSYDLINGVVIGSVTANVSAHWALSRIGTSFYLFKDGTLTNTVTLGTATIVGSGHIYLGSNSGGTNKMNGYIDELRYEKRGLWSTSFTPATTAYTATDQTVLLCHFEGANNDKVTLDSSESSYGTNGFGDTATPALTFAGSATLDTTYTRGGHGTSLKLNGTTQYASIQYATPSAGHPIYFSASDKLCIEGWFYVSSFSSAPGLFHLVGSSGTAANELYVSLTSGGLVGMDNSATRIITSSTAVTVGFNHIAIIREGRGWAISVNGNISTPARPDFNLAYASESYTLYMGCFRAVTNYLTGALDSFRITHGKPRYTANFTPGNLTQDDDTTLLWVFDGSVGQKWVKELSKNTALIQSTNARTVKDGRYITPTVTAANTLRISTSTSKFGSGCLQHSQTAGNYATLAWAPDFTPPGDFTVEAQVGYGGSGVSRFILAKANATNQTFGFYINASGQAVFEYRDTVGTLITATSSGAISTASFVHIAAIRTSGLLKIYADGIQVASVTATNGMRQDTTGVLYITADGSGSNVYAGNVDEIRISSVARWTAAFTPPALAYGQQYVTGPYYVTTSSASHIDLSPYSSIDNVAVTQSTPPNTEIGWVASFDNRTNWKAYNAGTWRNLAQLSDVNKGGVLFDFTKNSLDTRLTFSRSSIATYYDVNGILQTASSGVPRFDYDPITHLPRGLLIEESRTNSLRNSVAAGAVVGSPGTAPTNWNGLGTSNGVTLAIAATGTTSAGVSYVDVRISGTASATATPTLAFESTTQIVASVGQTWTQAVDLAVVGGSLAGITSVILRIREADSGGATLGDQVGSPLTLTSTLTRKTQTVTLAQASVGRVSPRIIATIPSGSTVDVTIRISCPQMELGAFATSYIPTSGAAVTRAADVCTMALTGVPGWDASAGTLIIEGDTESSDESVWCAIDNGGFGNLLRISRPTAGNARGFVNSASVTVADIYTSSGQLPLLTSRKAALSWAVNDYAIVANGGTVVTDSLGDLPTGMTTLRIGSGPTGSINGRVQTLALYNRRLSNSQLQSLTTSGVALYGVPLTATELQTALLTWAPSMGTTLDFAFSLKTANQQFTPLVDNILVAMDEYQMMQPVADYTVKFKKAEGVQNITFTRIKSGTANHKIAYL